MSSEGTTGSSQPSRDAADTRVNGSPLGGAADQAKPPPSKGGFRSWYRRRRSRARVRSTGLTPPSYLASVLVGGAGILLFLSGVIMVIFGFTTDTSTSAGSGFLRFGGATFGVFGFLMLMIGCKYFMVIHARHEGAQNRMFREEGHVVPGQENEDRDASASEWARQNPPPSGGENQHKVQSMFRASGYSDPPPAAAENPATAMSPPPQPAASPPRTGSLVVPGRSAAGIGVPAMFQASVVGRGEVGATFEVRIPARPAPDTVSQSSDTQQPDTGSLTNVYHASDLAQPPRSSVPQGHGADTSRSHTSDDRTESSLKGSKRSRRVFSRNSIYSRHDLDLDKNPADDDNVFTVTKSFKDLTRRHSTNMFLASSFADPKS